MMPSFRSDTSPQLCQLLGTTTREVRSWVTYECNCKKPSSILYIGVLLVVRPPHSYSYIHSHLAPLTNFHLSIQEMAGLTGNSVGPTCPSISGSSVAPTEHASQQADLWLLPIVGYELTHGRVTSVWGRCWAKVKSGCEDCCPRCKFESLPHQVQTLDLVEHDWKSYHQLLASYTDAICSDTKDLGDKQACQLYRPIGKDPSSAHHKLAFLSRSTFHKSEWQATNHTAYHAGQEDFTYRGIRVTLVTHASNVNTSISRSSVRQKYQDVLVTWQDLSGTGGSEFLEKDNDVDFSVIYREELCPGMELCPQRKEAPIPH